MAVSRYGINEQGLDLARGIDYVGILPHREVPELIKYAAELSFAPENNPTHKIELLGYLVGTTKSVLDLDDFGYGYPKLNKGLLAAKFVLGTNAEIATLREPCIEELEFCASRNHLTSEFSARLNLSVLGLIQFEGFDTPDTPVYKKYREIVNSASRDAYLNVQGARISPNLEFSVSMDFEHLIGN